MLNFLATKSIKTSFIPPYSLDITLEDFFATFKRKSELAEFSLSEDIQKGLGWSSYDYMQRRHCHSLPVMARAM
jgi:hypothetical protein